MKYKLFRSLGNLDQQVLKHELVAVEYGKNIDEVASTLVKRATEDLAGLTEYEHCETGAYAPELLHSHRRVKRYQYEMTGVVSPPKAAENILIEFGIMEEADDCV